MHRIGTTSCRLAATVVALALVAVIVAPAATFAGKARIAADITPGEGVPSGSDIVRYGKKVLFFGTRPGEGAELWKSDGSTSGTKLVRDIRLGPIGSGPRDLIVVDGIAYFTANEGVSGRELWVWKP